MKQIKLPLNEIGDKTVFKVPENYFVNFQTELDKRLNVLNIEKTSLEKIKQGETGFRRFVLKMDTMKPVLYMAAMFVLLLFSISLVLNFTSDNSSLKLSAESTTQSKSTVVPTAEDYLINAVGTYGITEYYVDSENLE